MKIKFCSLYRQEGQDQKAEFEVDAKYSKELIKHPFENIEYEYEVYEFHDPQSKQPTRIEINPKSVNVITNNATLQLRLLKCHNGSKIHLEKNDIILKTLMDKCIVSEKEAFFQYEMFSINDLPMGEFKITISHE
ncbi:hypothetical protein KQ873_02580 [Mycoplasma zalophidermidis]|uniref:hypothetical protein n=1 Tax=Mycoplasma zalophidermidis TaxID=398174 RepID=UPI001C0F86DD|nr:hypothetical protein [Mycoplasma zalophidermidis]MBU4689908.1 hypothetical protein [Mycoplasma zalophidermidis]